MKKCYEDETLTVSKGAFQAPKEMRIKVDCYQIENDTIESEQSIKDFNF
jgi:penicillin-binding protein 1A